jgi:predicted ATPase
MAFKEVEKIRKKMLTTGWPKFVNNLSINNVHGITDTTIQFKFPICAIIGENGTGKSTILKLLACAYKHTDKNKTLFPSDFFPDTIWDDIRGVELKYEIREGTNTKNISVKKRTERWRGLPSRTTNYVYYFDINRTMPIESVIGYSKLTKRTNSELSSRDLSEENTGQISEIMDRDYIKARYAKTSEDKSKEVGILKLDFGELSQFHQGAGEYIITNFISITEQMPNNSLVIIDEIESSLHPTAQRRLIRELLKITRIKQLQVIVSTHSPYVLSELPMDSRILLARTNTGIEVIYAPSVEFCLTQIDDKLHTELDIIVEDEESQCLISEIIRKFIPEAVSRVKIIPAGSADVVRILATLSNSNRIPYKMIGIVDPDQEEMDPALILPGTEATEKQIIKDIHEKNLESALEDMINLKDDMIKKEISSVILTKDHHDWLDSLSDKFNINKEHLWACLSTIWVNKILTEGDIQDISSSIKEKLNIVK